MQYVKIGKWSRGQISWDWNSTFSGGHIFDHEVEIQFVHDSWGWICSLIFDSFKLK